MKTYKLIQLACMVALMGAATGCADNVLVEESQTMETAKGQPITIQASVSGSHSRVAYGDEADQKISLTWQSDDVLKVYNPRSEAKLTDFTLTSGAGTAAGVFEGTPEVAFNDNDQLYAFYNNGMATADITSDGNIILSLKEQDGMLKDDFQLMYGETSYSAGTVQEVSLNSLVTILQLTIETDVSLKEVAIYDNGFCTDGMLILGNTQPSEAGDRTFEKGELVYSGTNENGKVTVKGNFEPNEEGKVTVYFYLLPCKRYTNEEVFGTEVTPRLFTAIDENNVEYVNSTDYQRTKNLEKGKMYRIQTGLFQLENFENEGSADGSVERPYEIANANQLYTLMLRLRKGINRPADNASYMDFSYKLIDDIELDGSVQWVGMNIGNGTFDGGGHTISGPISTNLFSELFGTTVKDLVLDLEFQDDAHASLALRSYGATIINCINKSSFSTNKDLVGGLVANMITGSKMIACANLGNVTVNGESVQSVGGLAGNLSSGSTIEGCYNLGTVSVSADNGSVGTLVGAINNENAAESGNSVMTACWSGVRGALVGSEVENTDYVACYEILDWDSTEEVKSYIESMNAALAIIGSKYTFDQDGKAYVQTTSSGGASGENFGNGGEF